MNITKFRRVLYIIAYSAIAVSLVLLLFYAKNRTPQSMFLFNCILPVVFFLGIPAFDSPYSLLGLWRKDGKKSELSPELWLIIYSLLLCLSIVFLVSSRSYFFDLPQLLGGSYSQTNVTSIRVVDSRYSKIHGVELCVVADRERFYIQRDCFAPLSDNEEYTLYYLNHTKWVTDIKNEKGVSLLL